MTATERLRQLLDERGVEWYEPTTKPNKTWFPDSNGINCSARPWSDKLEIKRHGLSPEQAVEATLGRGTCHRALDYDGTRYVCSACGEHFGPRRWHFCPNCGARVIKVKEDE